MSLDKDSIVDLDLGPLLQRRLLTPFLLKVVPHVPEDGERSIYPRYRNPLKWILFTWLLPVLSTGYKRTLEPNDLPKLNADIQAETIARNFQTIFDRRLRASQLSHLQNKAKERGEALNDEFKWEEYSADLEDYKVPNALCFYALVETFRFQYMLAILFFCLGLAAQTCNPLLSKKLITFVELRTYGFPTSIGKGVGYAIGVSLLVLVSDMIVNQGFYLAAMTGAQMKAGLTKAMLDKSFKLDAKSRKRYPASKITSIMATDLQRVDLGVGFSPFMFTFPVPVAISIGILVHNIHAPSMVGVGLMFGFLFVAAGLGAMLFGFRTKAIKLTDERINLMKQVLNNLKMIKFYSWELPYLKKINTTRSREMSFLLKMEVTRSVIISLAVSLTVVSSMAAFLVLYAIASPVLRNPAAIFSSVALFNLLAGQFIMLPLSLAGATDAFIGMRRVGEYLAASEIPPSEVNRDLTPSEAEAMNTRDLAISVDNSTFTWEIFELSDDEDKPDMTPLEKEQAKEAKKMAKKAKKQAEKDKKAGKLQKETSEKDHTPPEFWNLKDVDFQVTKGEFVVITGQIGSGKTSLLRALEGLMKRTSGEVKINGSLVMCGAPWIQNSTVRDNVTFSADFDEKWYREVVYSCSLESDLDILPAGDLTEIGERGITLSGGQKARVNLARAVYADSETILLDDVLSAVDAKVGKHIMDNCFMGVLRKKTRILATHQLSLIGSADRIIFLQGDGLIVIGTLEELTVSNQAFNDLMLFSKTANDDDELTDETEEETEKQMIESQLSRHSTTKLDDEQVRYEYNANNSGDGKLMSEEFKNVNAIDFSVYRRYIGAGISDHKFGWVLPATLTGTVLCVFFAMFTNVWLSFWIEDKFKGYRPRFYIALYVVWTVLAVLTVTYQFVGVIYIMNRAARKLNLQAVERILYVPMSYMDVTPMGRIINRFTKDTDTLDNEMGDKMAMIVYFFCTIAGVIILCIIYLPWFAIAVPFIVLIFIGFANFYLATGRELKRVEAVQRSNVYNNFNETLTGMDTIKAFNKKEVFLKKNIGLIDRMNEAYYITVANQRWLDVFLSALATVFALLISLLCVFRVFKISASSVGLLLSYVLQLSGMISMVVVIYTQVEQDMNSAERIIEYVDDLPQEARYQISETTPAPNWPQNGEIRFVNVSLAYRPGLPLVLKNFNADVKSNEKIGICGRTGAGKSSIMIALYRIAELSSGLIEIDGVDSSTLGLNNLRSKLSIIPQDPVLFEGTIRKNLDPFGVKSDDELWETLRRAGIIENIEMVKQQKPNSEEMDKFHLDRDVENDGENFSLGEKQLIAFARALVRESKVLVLDEATSSVDYATDSKIQAAIVREFRDCTILCIAHRLKTILNYDRIMVMDKGELKEFDTPWNLFNSRNSIFRQMCDKSDIKALEFSRR